MPYGDRCKAARTEVPAFTGKPDYSSEAFVVKLNTAYSTYAISASDRVQLALSRFEGEATKFQVELTSELALEGKEIPFDEFKHKLLTRFPVPTEETPQYLLLHKLQLGNDMAKFIQNFNRQVSRAGTGELANQNMLQEIFLSNLGGNLCQIVEQTRPEAG